MHMIHSRCPNPELKALASLASVDVHPCVSLCDSHTRGAHGATCPAPIDGSVAPMNVPTLRSSSPVLIFRRVVSVCHEPKLLWWTAQVCQLQICELMSSANPCIGSPGLSFRGTWPVLLCQTDLAAQIRPCLPSQPVALLRCRQVIVDFDWSGTVVWFCVPSRFSRLVASRIRLLRLHNGKIGAVPTKSL